MQDLAGQRQNTQKSTFTKASLIGVQNLHVALMLLDITVCMCVSINILLSFLIFSCFDKCSLYQECCKCLNVDGYEAHLFFWTILHCYLWNSMLLLWKNNTVDVCGGVVALQSKMLSVEHLLKVGCLCFSLNTINWAGLSEVLRS